MSDPTNPMQGLPDEAPAPSATSSQASQSIDPTEAARLAGYNPAETEQLVESAYKLVQAQEGGDTRPKHENPLVRLATVALPIGVIGGGAFGIWFLFMAPKGDKQPEVIASPTPTPTLATDNEGTLKSQLAFQDQQALVEKTEAKPNKRSKDAKETERQSTRSRRVASVSEPETIRSTPPARRYPTSVTARSATPAATPPKPELVDPFARWTALAKLGQQGAEKQGTSETTSEAVAASNQPTGNAGMNDRLIPTVQVGMQSAAAESSEEPDITEPHALPGLLQPPMFQFPTNTQTVVASTKPFGGLGFGDALTTEERILQADIDIAPAAQPGRVAIGTTVSARVVVPMIASQDSKGLGRFVVELTQDVPAMDRSVALPKGTLLITEITNFEKQTHLVNQSAVAIVYKDRLGTTQQQQIPAESLLVRGRGGEPLIATSNSDPGGAIAGQDLLVSLLSGLGKIGEVVNRPQEDNTIILDGLSSSQVSRRTTREPNLLAAALEGAFGVAADRLRQRSDKATEALLSQPKVLVVKQGEEVSVIFNTFFEIQR
ncbi:MAG: hypothetical protein KME45_31990 [Stenomitos rutilans HA7619-LM2]|jgi:hypothetical protein|nr:hypothetical protein [Stenomitos rutilans HA7619-LM2]